MLPTRKGVKNKMQAVISFLSTQGFANFLILVGVAVATWSIFSNRTITRRKQTAEMLLALRSDDKIGDGYKVLRTRHENKGKKSLEQLANPSEENEDELRDADCTRYLLNHWETVAVGIKQGIYCKRILKEAHCTIICNMVNQAEPYIKKVRANTGKNTIWREIELLANEWVKNPLK